MIILNSYPHKREVIDPSTLSPQSWIDFSDASSLILASGRITTVSNQVGGGPNYTQTTAGRRPLVLTNAQNGLQVARFQAARNDLLANSLNSLLRNTSGATIFLVARVYTITGGTQILCQISGGSGSQRASIAVDSTGRLMMQTRSLDGDSTGSSVVPSNVIVDTSKFFIFSASISYITGLTRVYLNRGSGVLGSNSISYLERWNPNATTPNNTSNTNPNVSRLGGLDGGNLQSDSGLGEWIVFDSLLSDKNRRGVEAWLQDKWQI